LNGEGFCEVMFGAPGFTDGLPGYAAMIFGSQAQLRLTVTPRDGPIVIPLEGGSFRYDLEVANDTGNARTLDVWVVLSGQSVTRTLVRFRQSFPPGEFHRTLTQRIPGSLEAGNYVMIGNLGKFPTARATDNFVITKE
jgi:hypothetical protein